MSSEISRWTSVEINFFLKFYETLTTSLTTPEYCIGCLLNKRLTKGGGGGGGTILFVHFISIEIYVTFCRIIVTFLVVSSFGYGLV